MRLYPSSSRLRLDPTRAPLSPSLSRAREPRASPSRLTLTTGIRLSRFPRRVAIRSSRSARRPRRPLTPSRSHGVRISPTRSPLPPSPFRACPCPCLSPLIAPIYLLRVYLSFFSPLSLPPPFLAVSVSLALGPRNSVEHTRRRAFDTLCSVSEGSARRFHGVAPFSTERRRASLFLLLTRRNALAPCSSA